MSLQASVHEQLAAMVAGEQLELLAAEVVGAGPKTVLRLVVDGPEGVTLDQCARISRQASAMLDVDEPFRHRYTLEVSSPGIDRKLYREADYRRFAGRQVKVKMKPSYREHRVVVAELVGLKDGQVTLTGDDGGTITLPLEEISETRLQVEWETIMKEGKSRR